MFDISCLDEDPGSLQSHFTAVSPGEFLEREGSFLPSCKLSLKHPSLTTAETATAIAVTGMFFTLFVYPQPITL
ncbi:hypothetical protein DL96DRAFT_1702384 [Flagelloscypha sp. PMI_526]|nr:hypothetical protein DL96DRAFT_1702384 [Flagelloscypha sp. PMI_526]